jgi:hypothetical protein
MDEYYSKWADGQRFLQLPRFASAELPVCSYPIDGTADERDQRGCTGRQPAVLAVNSASPGGKALAVTQA